MHCLCPKQLDHTLGRGGTWGAYMAVLSVVMKVTLSVCVQALCMVAIARDLYYTCMTTACMHHPRGNVWVIKCVSLDQNFRSLRN